MATGGGATYRRVYHHDEQNTSEGREIISNLHDDEYDRKDVRAKKSRAERISDKIQACKIDKRVLKFETMKCTV